MQANGSGIFTVGVEATGGATNFRRGDVNSDDGVNVADAIALLGYLFSGAGPLVCLESGDVNNDGSIDISDAISILGYLISGGATPPQPFPGCGPDTDTDSISCNAPTGSC